MRNGLALAALAVAALLPAQDAASYESVNTRLSVERGTTVFSPLAHAQAFSRGGRDPRINDSVDCGGVYTTCTDCAADSACAWCKNLNRCVTELFSRMTCVDSAKPGASPTSTKNSNLGGVFGPEQAFDHVGQVSECGRESRGLRTIRAAVCRASCGGVLYAAGCDAGRPLASRACRRQRWSPFCGCWGYYYYYCDNAHTITARTCPSACRPAHTPETTRVLPTKRPRATRCSTFRRGCTGSTPTRRKC